ncbi:MAG: amidohydrolase, partial [Hyphomonadaceae bacterium]
MRKTLSAAAFMLGAALAPAAGAQTQAAVVYKNAKIYTLDGKSSVASAVAIAGERFLAVGDEAAVQPFIGAGTQVVDLAGAAVIPGLNDTHAHFLSAGVEASQIPMRGAKNVAEALERIKTAAAAKKPGEWLLGASWHPPSQLAEHRYLTRAEIDSVAPNNPVYLQTVGHVAMANSAALKIAGIDRNTPNPEGGTIQKDQAGEPDGILFERAIEMVEKKAPPVTMAELEGQYLAAMKNANSLGLTSVLDPGAPIANIRALQRITQAGKSTLRLGVMYAPSPTVPPEQWAQEVNTLVASGFGNEWLRLNAIGEMAIDG